MIQASSYAGKWRAGRELRRSRVGRDELCHPAYIAEVPVRSVESLHHGDLPTKANRLIVGDL